MERHGQFHLDDYPEGTIAVREPHERLRSAAERA
jgi:hypothetical protein